MTIAVSGNFTEGVVLGADSAASYQQVSICTKPGCGQQTSVISNVFNGAQKIYHIGRDHLSEPYAGMIYGASQYAGQSWRNIFAQASDGISVHDAAADAFGQLRDFLNKLEPDASKRPAGGVFFCGYGKNDAHVCSYKLDMATLNHEEFLPGFVAWDGVTHVVQQLVNGVNCQTRQALEGMFDVQEIDLTDVAGATHKRKVVEVIVDLLKGTSARCNLDTSMPIRDAIDYVHFLVYSTVKHYKFAHLEPVCGGEVEVAVITRDRGFRRIKTKPMGSEL